MMTKEEFMKWLNEPNSQPLSLKQFGSCYTYLKAPQNDDFSYLYYQRNYRTDTLIRNDDFIYTGIYYKENGLIYDACGHFSALFPDIEYPETVEQMADSITENVQKTVEEMVGSDRSTLSISELSENGHRSLAHFEEFVSEGKTRNLFLKGTDSSQLRYECDYAFDEWEDQELLEYIRNPSGFIRSKAKQYFDTHQEDILLEFEKNDLIKAKLQEVESLGDSPLHRIRNIMTAMNGIAAKTVNVTVCKDGTEFTFKTEASELRRDPVSHYSTWNIAAKDRSEFEMLFGRHESYYPEEITDISYCGKSVYSAEPYEAEQTENESITMSM